MKDKVVIITGATKGIGESCVEVFSEAGAKIVACARGEKDGAELCKRIDAKFGEGTCTFMRCDVTSEEDIKNVVAKTVEKFGRIDCLLNNAGYHPGEEEIDDISVEMFEQLLRLNLTSIFMFNKYALPYIRKQKGTIVNMGSLVHEIGQVCAIRYVSTKGAIASMTRAMALDEAKYGVRVNCVSPGCIATPLTIEYMDSNPNPEKIRKANAAYAALDRHGLPREIANAMLFLASGMSTFITGVDLPISGGSELGYGMKHEI